MRVVIIWLIYWGDVWKKCNDFKKDDDLLDFKKCYFFGSGKGI